MQSRLVLHETGQQGVTVFLVGDGEPIKPACQGLIEMALDSDLVQDGIIHLVIESFRG